MKNVKKNCCCGYPKTTYSRGTQFIGPMGPMGPMGPQGTGLQIDGHVQTVEQLPLDNLFNGMAYTVGNSNPNNLLYIYNAENNMWINEGYLRGPKGDDGLTPDIGENGNWWIGGVDTNIRAIGLDGPAGRDGEDGDTPEISEDGTWIIGGEDTGLRAIGQDGRDGFNGDDGDTPEIGTNGNWWIAGEDTGLPSRGEKGDPGDAFFPAYASLYSSTAQTFPAQELEYSFVKFQGTILSGISLENDTDIGFDHDGLYQITYSLTAATKPELATIAIVNDDGSAKSNSVQAIKPVGTETSMTFIANCTEARKIRLGVLTSEELTLENAATNLVNANLTIVELNVNN